MVSLLLLTTAYTPCPPPPTVSCPTPPCSSPTAPSNGMYIVVCFNGLWLAFVLFHSRKSLLLITSFASQFAKYSCYNILMLASMDPNRYKIIWPICTSYRINSFLSLLEPHYNWPLLYHKHSWDWNRSPRHIGTPWLHIRRYTVPHIPNSQGRNSSPLPLLQFTHLWPLLYD